MRSGQTPATRAAAISATPCDWGDGTPDTTGTRAGGPPSTSLLAKHTYALSGIYVISLTGDVISGDCTFLNGSAAFEYKGPCTTGDIAPSASSQQFTSPAVNVGARLTADLAAKAGSTPILTWNLISQSFGTASWHFHWNRDGTFVIIRQSKNAVHFTYSVTGTDDCTSKLATVTIGGTAGSFSSTSGRTQTPILRGTRRLILLRRGQPEIPSGHRDRPGE